MSESLSLTPRSLASLAVYDVSRRETFENLDLWLEEVEVYSPTGGKDVVKLLVGNKIDKERAVSRKEADAWARSKGMLFLESSAKTRVGIQQVTPSLLPPSPLCLSHAHTGAVVGA